MKQSTLGVLVLLALALLFYQSGAPAVDTEGLAAETESGSPERPASTEVPVELGVRDSQAPPTPSPRTEVETQDAAAPNPAAEAPAPLPTIRGRVILIDPNGFERTNLNGSFRVWRWTGQSGDLEKVHVVNGVFDALVSDADRFTLDELKIGGRAAVLIDPSQEFPLDQGTILIRAQWTRSVRLCVLSAETKEHLTGITLVPLHGYANRGRKHPGIFSMNRARVRAGVSPIELLPSAKEAKNNSQTYLVHSPGFAWQSVRLDMLRGGDREVRLERGGDLSVQLRGELPKGETRLFLLPANSEYPTPIADFTTPTTYPVIMKSLAPGHYVARVLSGSAYGNSVGLGEVQVEVVAGQRKSYELFLTPVAPVLLDSLAGTVVLPKAWGFDEFELSASFQGTSPDGKRGRQVMRSNQMTELASEPDTWSFDFGEVPTGIYQVSLYAGRHPDWLHFASLARVEEGGTRSFRLTVPPPASISIRLLDGDSGHKPDVERIHWMSSHSTSGGMTEVLPSGPDGLYEFRAPLEWITLDINAPGYGRVNKALQLKPGANEITVTLYQNCPLLISFLDGETLVPFNGHGVPKTLGSERDILDAYFISLDQSGFRTALSEPGSYIFEIPRLEGFEPIPNQTIRVARGELTRHRIQLKRLP